MALNIGQPRFARPPGSGLSYGAKPRRKVLFENSASMSRYGGASTPIRVHMGYVPHLEHDESVEKKTRQWALLAALILHIGLLLITVKGRVTPPEWAGSAKTVYVMQPVRFRSPFSLSLSLSLFLPPPLSLSLSLSLFLFLCLSFYSFLYL